MERTNFLAWMVNLETYGIDSFDHCIFQLPLKKGAPIREVGIEERTSWYASDIVMSAFLSAVNKSLQAERVDQGPGATRRVAMRMMTEGGRLVQVWRLLA